MQQTKFLTSNLNLFFFINPFYCLFFYVLIQFYKNFLKSRKKVNPDIVHINALKIKMA